MSAGIQTDNYWLWPCLLIHSTFQSFTFCISLVMFVKFLDWVHLFKWVLHSSIPLRRGSLRVLVGLHIVSISSFLSIIPSLARWFAHANTHTHAHKRRSHGGQYDHTPFLESFDHGADLASESHFLQPSTYSRSRASVASEPLKPCQGANYLSLS